MSNKTAFVWDEKCFWHAGGNYAFLAPVGGLVQPMVSGGLPEAPETKRRLKNLMDVTGLSAELMMMNAPHHDGRATAGAYTSLYRTIQITV